MVSCDFYSLADQSFSERDERERRTRWDNLPGRVIVNEHSSYLPEVAAQFFLSFALPPSTIILRRDIFSTAGLFDESLLYNADVEYFARVLAHHSLAIVEERLVYCRIHSGSHSTNTEGKWNAYLAIVDRKLRNPAQYPPGAGQVHRQNLKRMFVGTERLLARRRDQ